MKSQRGRFDLPLSNRSRDLFWLVHPKTAVEYTGLKTALKQKNESDRYAYTDAKTGFIKRETELARLA